jgi:hypothetical protein
MLWIFLGVIVLLLIAISAGNGAAVHQARLSEEALALHERVKRQGQNPQVAQLGSSEFSILYKKAEKRRRRLLALIVLIGNVLALLLVFEFLFVYAGAALMAITMVFSIFGYFRMGEDWFIRKIERYCHH